MKAMISIFFLACGLQAQMVQAILMAPTPAAGGGAITKVCSGEATGSGAGSSITTTDANCTGANFFWACVASNTTNPTVSDDSSNSYTGLTQKTDIITAANARCSFAANASTSSTFQVSTTSDFPYLCYIGFANVKTASPKDGETGLNDAVGSPSTTISSGSITPSETDEVMLDFISSFDAGAQVWSIDSGYTVEQQATSGSGVNYGGACAYKIKTDTAAENPAWDPTAFSMTGAVSHSSYKKN